MCPSRSCPQETQFSKHSSTLGSGECRFFLETSLSFFQQTHIDGSFPSFFADALRAAHHMLFPPRDLLFPKLFDTESPKDETGETRPLSAMAPSVPSTPVRTASVIALFLGCLGLPWFGFGTCSQSLASAWAWWGHRRVSLPSPAALLFTVCDLEGGEFHLALSQGLHLRLA